MRAQPTGKRVSPLSRGESMVHQLPTATPQTEAEWVQDPHHNPTFTPIPYPPPHPSACSGAPATASAAQSSGTDAHVHKAYPESLQKYSLPILTSFRRAASGPVLISWRA